MCPDGTGTFIEALQVGNSCPICEQALQLHDHAMICNACGAIHHARCFQAEGCGSYHCRTDGGGARVLVPDLVLSKNEVAQVILPPSGRQHSTEALAAEVEGRNRQPTRLSKLAVISTFFSLIGFGAAFRFMTRTGGLGVDDQILFGVTMVVAMLGAIVGAIALARIQNNRALSGNVPGLAAICIAGLSVMLALYGFQARGLEEQMAPTDFQVGKVKDFVDRADARIKVPLMANVHIAIDGFLGQAQGSGVVLSVTGGHAYVLSNVHVVTSGRAAKHLDELKKGPRIKVTYYSGESQTADPVWLAPYGIDLVLLKVPAPTNFKPPTKLQPNRLLAIGQRVFAIGNPVGLNWSYTEGVISGMRTQQYGPHELTVIQMQTPLNPGNSGGGLYDQDGFLVGVNTWIYSKSKTEGLNFSLSVDGLFKVIDPAVLKMMTLDHLAPLLVTPEAPLPVVPSTPAPTGDDTGAAPGRGTTPDPGGPTPAPSPAPSPVPDPTPEAPDAG